MIAIPYLKAHGARNDFLLTWRGELPSAISDFEAAARAICDRNTGVGADGWILLSFDAGASPEGADGSIDLWNSDGSRSEISGNGTRCAAAALMESGRVPDRTGQKIVIRTGAGTKHLTLLERRGLFFLLEMNMGCAKIEELCSGIALGRESVILNVGNPQCAVFVPDFKFDWQSLGAQLERHPRFPNRTNVSFVRVADRHTLDVRFFERGAGETMSSGTGSTGAAAAAYARGFVEPPVQVLTPAGPLRLRWQGEEILLAGPAEITARGEFYWIENSEPSGNP
ncbi:MAG TPA: diaminopimelate epimerase [Bryobacteraceae bacterium]|nr:diaminopimelate epimerase [Bryobacteraceae bacterium]